MLLQSHVSGFLYLLPALPTAFSQGGVVRGLQARGGVEVTLRWRGGQVVAAKLLFGRRHPYRSVTDDVAVGVTSPNPLRIVRAVPGRATDHDSKATGSALACTVSEDRVVADAAAHRVHTFRLEGPPHHVLTIAGPPLAECALYLCGVDVHERDCVDSLPGEAA
jgi:hypothetical protein